MNESKGPDLTLEGSEGGGQFFRSALSLSVLTGRSVTVENVRGARKNPGLKPQHVAAAEALAAIADADAEGIERGSRTVSFSPGTVRPGRYAVAVDTAGSAPLVVDAVLPLALLTPGPIRLEVTGGTDVKWSPPLSYLRRVKLPLLREAGLVAAVDAGRRGFYPVGGGEVALSMGSSTLAPIALEDRGSRRGVRAFATASTDLADADVAERLGDAAVDRLCERKGDAEDAEATEDAEDAEDGWSVLERGVTYVDTDCSGAVLVLVGEYLSGGDGDLPNDGSSTGSEFRPACRFGTSALGEPGVPSEEVAGDAVETFRETVSSGATVDVHLADQLLPFLAVAGGAFRAPRLSEHLETHLALLEQFGAPVEWTERDDGTVDVSAPGTSPDGWPSTSTRDTDTQ